MVSLSIKTLLVLVGTICLFLAGLNVSSPRVNFGFLGFAFIAAGVFLLA